MAPSKQPGEPVMYKMKKNNNVWNKIEITNNLFDGIAQKGFKQKKPKPNYKPKPKEETPYYEASHFYEIAKGVLGKEHLKKNIPFYKIGGDRSSAIKLLLLTREIFPKFGVPPEEILNSTLQQIFLKVRGSMRHNDNSKKKKFYKTY